SRRRTDTASSTSGRRSAPIRWRPPTCCCHRSSPRSGRAVAELVLRVDRDRVAELRLNRPDNRNALSTALLTELRDHLAAVQADPSVRVLLLPGAGPAFSAGADLREFAPGTPSAATLSRFRLVVENLRRIGELEQPTLA